MLKRCGAGVAVSPPRQLRLREGADLGGVRVDVAGRHGFLRGGLEGGDATGSRQEPSLHRGHGLVVEVDALRQVLAQVFDVAGVGREAHRGSHPHTSNGPTEAINGRLEHLRGSALGFRNLTNYITRALLETGGFRPQLHPQL